MTLTHDLVGSFANQIIKISEEGFNRNHVHLSKHWTRRVEHSSTPQDTHIVPALAVIRYLPRCLSSGVRQPGVPSSGSNLLFFIQLKHNFCAHAGPDHLVKLQYRQNPGYGAIVRNVVEVNGIALSSHGLTQMRSELADPDAESGRSCPQRRRMIAVYLAILPLTQTIDLIGQILSDTSRTVYAVHDLARERLVMALAGREIVIVVVKRVMETSIVRMDTRDVVKAAEQCGRSVEVLLPGGIRTGLDRVEQLRAGRTAVLRFKTVNATCLLQIVRTMLSKRNAHLRSDQESCRDISYLDLEGKWLSLTPHAVDNHASDLICDEIISGLIDDLCAKVIVLPARQKAKKVMVDTVQIGAVLPRILQAARGDLGELACPNPTRWDEWIHRGDVALTVDLGSLGAIKGLSICVQARVVAVPMIRLNGECVGSIRRALVMAMDLLG